MRRPRSLSGMSIALASDVKCGRLKQGLETLLENSDFFEFKTFAEQNQRLDLLSVHDILLEYGANGGVS